MSYSYRYLSKKNKIISFSLVLISFLIIVASTWGCIISSYRSDPGVVEIVGVAIITFIIVGIIWSANERFIKNKCIQDEVFIDNEKISSHRYGVIKFCDIIKYKSNDISKVYSFRIKTNKSTFKFSCLSFLGSEGDGDYLKDKVALKTLAEEIVRVVGQSESHIKQEKESTSDVLLILSSLAMLLLIPGLIYAPQRMIFVIPFVVPVFFVILKKRRDNKKKK